MLGALDITSLVERSNVLLMAFAKLSATRISQAMLDDASRLERALLADYYLVSQHSSRPVIALGSRLTFRPSFAADQLAGTIIRIQPLPDSAAEPTTHPMGDVRLRLPRAVGSSAPGSGRSGPYATRPGPRSGPR